MRGQVDWAAIGPLPRVSPWRKGERSLTWAERCAAYAALAKAPVIITARLVTPVLHAEAQITHLDGILSAAAITDHPAPSAWDLVAIVPLPLELAWVSPQGLPLWACTPLMPVDAGLVSREYWHKRYPSHRAELGDKQSANTSAGRWREYRVPVAAHAVDRLHALAIGNADELRRLLDGVTHIGKKGSMGYGRVACWSITTATHTLADVLALRPVPVSAGLVDAAHVDPQRGWTPPYWYAPHWTDCAVPA
jgi:hypothetical protein